MSFGSSEAAAILKEHYPFAKVKEAGYRKNKFFATIPKRTDAGGDQEKVTVDVASSQARSATFATAQTLAATNSTIYKAFECTTVQNYAVARISGKVFKQTSQNVHAFVRAWDSELKGAFKSITRDVERDLFRDGSGAIGTWASESTVTATLGHQTQAHCFEYGMELVFAANTASALRDSADSLTVVGVQRQAGKLVSDVTWSTQITGLTASDSIFCQGDYVTTSDRLKLSGLEAWCPSSDPGATAFFGVARNADVERLGGVRYDGSSDTMVEAAIKGQSAGSANGAVPRIAFVNNCNMEKILLTLQSQKTYDVRRETINAQGPNGPIGAIGFSAVTIDGDEGPISFLTNPLCPYDVMWMFDPDELYLFTMGEGPDVLDEDGLSMLRVSNDDSYECRVGYYGQVISTNPGGIVRVKLA